MPTRQHPKRRRNPRGTTQNRRNAIATNPSSTLKRRFIFQEQIQLNNSLGTNTIHESYQSFNTLSVQGYSTVARTFDQYRVTRARVYLQNVLPPFDPAITPSAISRNMARLPRNANPSVNCMTAVDHTPGTTAGSNIYAYNNVQFRVPDNDFSTKIADFTPRLDSGDALIRPTNNFVSCASNNIRWTGFQLYLVNTGGNLPNSVWSDPLFQQTYLLRYELEIEFKQPIHTLTAPLLTNFSSDPKSASNDDPANEPGTVDLHTSPV